VYYASLTSLARAAVKEAASGHDCLNIIDGAKLVDNYCSLKSTGLTPLIKAVDMAGEMGNLLADQVEEAPFLVFNKPEIVSALDLGIDPANWLLLPGSNRRRPSNMGSNAVLGCSEVVRWQTLTRLERPS